jgi:hypothetical protein
MSSGSRLPSSTGLVTSQVTRPGGSRYSQTSEWLNGTPIKVSTSTYGRAMAANTVIWPTGSGMGSRKSYSL